MRSGHAERVAAVTSPAATMATFAKTSLRAERNAARVRLPPCARKRANMSAQERLTASAPRPASESGTGAGGTGNASFCHAVQSVARPGASRMPASTIPTSARRRAPQPSAARMSRLTEASSRKSMLSANSDTDPIASATANSTPK